MKNSSFTRVGRVLWVALLFSACSEGLLDAATETALALESGDGNGSGRSGGQRGGHRRPPEEAFTACESLAAGDACTVVLPDGSEHAGSCQTPPEGAPTDAIFCVPDDLPEGGPEGGMGGRRPHGPPPEEAFTVCEEATEGDGCIVSLEDTELTGTCMLPPAESGETRLVCAPEGFEGPPCDE